MDNTNVLICRRPWFLRPQDIQLDQRVKLAKPTSTPDDHVAEDPIVNGNPKIELTSDVPGLVVKTAPLVVKTADDIPNVENIGGGAYEVRCYLAHRL